MLPESGTDGGATLAYLMRTTKKGGAIAAIGVSGGAAFRATVFPLILRGIKVLGIDMPSTPLQMRRELWEEVMREATLLSLVDSISYCVKSMATFASSLLLTI